MRLSKNQIVNKIGEDKTEEALIYLIENISSDYEDYSPLLMLKRRIIENKKNNFPSNQERIEVERNRISKALLDYLQNISDDTFIRLTSSKELYNSNFTLYIFDLDDFTNINKLHGYEVGNQIIKEILDIIKFKLNQYDLKVLDYDILFIDEFYIFFHEPAGKIISFIEDIRLFISEYNWSNIVSNLFLRISGGYCDLDYKNQEPIEDLFIRTLIGVKNSKITGKNVNSTGPIYLSNYKKLTIRHYSSGSLDYITGFDDGYVGNELQVVRGEKRVYYLHTIVYSDKYKYMTSVYYWSTINYVQTKWNDWNYKLNLGITFKTNGNKISFQGGFYQYFFHRYEEWSHFLGEFQLDSKNQINGLELIFEHTKQITDTEYLKSFDKVVNTIKGMNFIQVKKEKIILEGEANLEFIHHSFLGRFEESNLDN